MAKKSKPAEEKTPLELALDALSAKHRKFVQVFVRNGFNATDAAREAGYSGKYVDRTAWSIARRPDVKKAVHHLIDEQVMSQQENLARLADIATATMDDFVDIDADGQPVLNLNKAKERGKLHLLKKVGYDSNGRPRIELHDAHGALRDIGRHYGLFVDRQEGVITHRLGDELIDGLENLSSGELEQRIEHIERLISRLESVVPKPDQTESN